MQAAFKFEEIPNSRAWAADCSVSDFKMLLTVIHSKTFSYCDFMLVQTSLSVSHTHTHIQRHTWETTILWNNVILALCSNIFYYICSILVHTKTKWWSQAHNWYHDSLTVPAVSRHGSSLSSLWTGLLVHASITLGASLLFQVLTAEPIFQ